VPPLPVLEGPRSLSGLIAELKPTFSISLRENVGFQFLSLRPLPDAARARNLESFAPPLAERTEAQRTLAGAQFNFNTCRNRSETAA
jgi:hypothetical protein